MTSPPPRHGRLLTGLLLVVGWLSLILGIIGAFLPVLPTTPFVLLAAACFMRSSTRLHSWLVSHRRFGPMISSYLAGEGIPARTKAVAIAMLWASVISSIIWVIPHTAADIFVGCVAVGVTVYLLRLPTADPR